MGITDIVIQGNSNAAVAPLREDHQRILQPMMSEAVGVVAQEHAGQSSAISRSEPSFQRSILSSSSSRLHLILSSNHKPTTNRLLTTDHWLLTNSMRLAIAGFMHESNTFNPVITDRAAFEAQSLMFGADLIDEWGDAHHEIGGFLEAAEVE